MCETGGITLTAGQAAVIAREARARRAVGLRIAADDAGRVRVDLYLDGVDPCYPATITVSETGGVAVEAVAFDR